MHVGITGTTGSGKGEIVRILRSHGFVHYGFGDMLRRLLRESGADVSNPTTREFANNLRKTKGASYLAEQLLHQMQSDAPKRAVFESVRNLSELNTLRRLPGFLLISVEAPREVRYERVKARGRGDGIESYDAFVAADDAQLEGDSHEQQLLAVIAQADIRIVNIGDLDELRSEVEGQLEL